MLKKILIGVVVLVVGLCAVGMLLPDKAHVERSAVIGAPACTVYAQLDDFKRFNLWSPWAEKDPKTAYTFTGKAGTPGATMVWKSDKDDVGSGTQTLQKLDPCKGVVIGLEFDGMEGGGTTATHTLTKEGAGTKVTWAFDTGLGSNPMMRYMGLMMDGMIGGDYESGLARLKKLAEGLPKADFAGLAVEEVTAEARPMAYVSTASSMDPAEVGKAMGAAYGEIMAWLPTVALAQGGAPISVTTKEEKGRWEFDAAIPLSVAAAAAVAPTGNIKLGQTPAGRFLKVVHKGAYAGLAATGEKLKAYIAAKGIAGAAGSNWEEYLSDPGSTPEADLLTHLYVGLK